MCRPFVRIHLSAVVVVAITVIVVIIKACTLCWMNYFNLLWQSYSYYYYHSHLRDKETKASEVM